MPNKLLCNWSDKDRNRVLGFVYRVSKRYNTEDSADLLDIVQREAIILTKQGVIADVDLGRLMCDVIDSDLEHIWAVCGRVLRLRQKHAKEENSGIL